MMPPLRPFRPAHRRTIAARAPIPAPTHRASRELPRRRLALAFALTAALTPAAAQHVPPADNSRYARAIAAGYKALTYCNGIFVAGRTPAQIDADELSGIYPEYDAIVPTLTARIVRSAALVDVSYDEDLDPRFAALTPGVGCTLAPIGGRRGPFPTYLTREELAKREAPLDAATRAAKARGELPPLLLDYEPPMLEPEPPAADPRPWPTGDRGVTLRPGPRLLALVTGAFGDRYGPGAKTTGVVVLRNGKVVAERYAPGWGPFVANRTWSAAKSLAGTLIGLASADPSTALAVRDAHVLTQWDDDGRRFIRLTDLLHMASGLHSDSAGNRTDAIYFGGVAVDEEAVAWPLEAPPGRRFRYANNDILLAMLAVRQKIGDPAYRILPFGLLAPLGMSHTIVGQDPHGNYILSSQVWSTARDLARLGQFWLQDGVWQGKRLLPEGWVKYMTTPSGPQPTDGPGYGATMWLFGPRQGLPAGSYAAQGNRGQYVMVVPSERLVVVRRGEDPGAARFDIARFTADVIAAGR